jgi:glycosyltransferase involved in cell wall biosynthesis
MKVLVLNNAAPFIRGGAEELADELVRRLNRTKGIEAELLRVPFRWEPADCILTEILLNQNLRLYDVDRTIGLKFPAYLIPHECKVLWLLHQFRQAYDLYESGTSHPCSDAHGQQKVVKLVRNADREAFKECRAIYTNSPVTQTRLQKFNGIASTVLRPPLLDAERFIGGSYGDYFFAGGRVGPGKRQHLLVEAMQHVRSNVRLVIAGPLDDESYGDRLQKMVAQHNLAGRVELRFGFHSRDVIAKLVNEASACVYLPIDEDSFGYVTMEAFAAAKAVITTSDAGGVLELVHDNETGCVSVADAESLALKLDMLSTRQRLARKMGGAAKLLLDGMGLSWDYTVERLLSD